MDVAERIREAGGSLTSAERRVAEVLLARPQLIGFGTVADLAGAAGTGAATVIRLATKLGFSGFSELQTSVQHDLSRQLRPAAERIRERGTDNPFAQHRATEMGNVSSTLDAIETETWTAVVGMLADPERRILVLAGDAATGVALQFVTDLFSLRPEVRLIDGNEIEVRRELAFAPPNSVLVAIDLRRYDRWVLELVTAAHERQLAIVAITDSVLSPLAQGATHTFVTAAESVSPFDSHVGTLALLNLMVASVADEVRTAASERLDRAEQAWSTSRALTDG